MLHRKMRLECLFGLKWHSVLLCHERHKLKWHSVLLCHSFEGAESHDVNHEWLTVTYHQNMHTTIISIETASAITELSRRTWWRRISAGEVTRVTDDDRGRAMLLLSEVEPHICVAIEPEDKQFILLADAGDAEAQDDIGQLFLMSEKYQAAIYWFEQAAQQNNADAMQWLGHCYINGKGVPKDENLGIMWTAKAAALGHVIAQGQMKGLINQALDSHPASDLT